MVGLEYYKHY